MSEAIQESVQSVEKKKVKKVKKTRKRIIAIVITLIVLAAIIFGLVKLFKEPESDYSPMTDFAYRGSITTMIEGSGMVQPASSETIAPTQKGLVKEVFVDTGEYVEAGTLLYSVDPTEAQETLDDAKEALQSSQESLDDLNEQLTDLYESQEKLTITAPFDGKITSSSIKVGDSVSKDSVIAKVIDDSKLRLTQYYSYAYAAEIKSGMKGSISVPATMSTLDATVESVTMIERISDEGGKLFEVKFVADNPGTLTAGMSASGTVISSTGETLYSYESGKLENFQEKDIVAGASGTAITVNLKDYLKVTAGTLLAKLDTDTIDEELRSVKSQLESAQSDYDDKAKAVEDAQEQFDGFSAKAAISGTVMSCTLYPNEEIVVGTSAITIADTSLMYLEAQIDGQDVSKVAVGMPVNIVADYGSGASYAGTVVSVSLEGEYNYGVSYFPAKIEIQNADGALMSGMYLSYSIAGSQSDDCILVPTQAVKNTEMGTCVFIKGEDVPGAVELPDGIVPEGFSAVLVETGLSDDSVVEIKSGIEDGTEVFTQYMTDSANNWDNGGIMVG
ncbi:MAG: efflux RND transporter periplasmic adaptor subunit [Oscillospiraceae bacterium]